MNTGASVKERGDGLWIVIHKQNIETRLCLLLSLVLQPANHPVVLLAALEQGETAEQAFFRTELMVERFDFLAVDADALALYKGARFGL